MFNSGIKLYIYIYLTKLDIYLVIVTPVTQNPVTQNIGKMHIKKSQPNCLIKICLEKKFIKNIY